MDYYDSLDGIDNNLAHFSISIKNGLRYYDVLDGIENSLAHFPLAHKEWI